MSAVLGAFAQYAVSFLVYAVVAVLGVLCGKKIHNMRSAGKNNEDKKK